MLSYTALSRLLFKGQGYSNSACSSCQLVYWSREHCCEGGEEGGCHLTVWRARATHTTPSLSVVHLQDLQDPASSTTSSLLPSQINAHRQCPMHLHTPLPHMRPPHLTLARIILPYGRALTKLKSICRGFALSCFSFLPAMP